MRLDFSLTGGYANLDLTFQADTETLPAEVAAQIEAAVDQADFFDLPAEAIKPRSPGPPDVITYRISISAAGRTHTVIVNDITAPDSLRPLLGILQELAWEERRWKK